MRYGTDKSDTREVKCLSKKNLVNSKPKVIFNHTCTSKFQLKSSVFMVTKQYTCILWPCSSFVFHFASLVRGLTTQLPRLDHHRALPKPSIHHSEAVTYQLSTFNLHHATVLFLSSSTKISNHGTSNHGTSSIWCLPGVPPVWKRQDYRPSSTWWVS